MDLERSELASTLDALVSSIRDVLCDELIGIYLFGSSVSGGFDPGVSDLDLLAVTGPEVGAIDLAGLEQMHHEFARRNREWDDRIEVVYIGRETLRTFRGSRGSLAVISPGEPFHVAGDIGPWLQNWYLVRETGVTLYGPTAIMVIPPVSWDEFVGAVVCSAAELRDLRGDEGGPGFTAYRVLTLCRALRTVREGTHGSKQEAAAWASERMPDWAWLIDAALRCRVSRGTAGFDDEAMRAAAQAFIGLLADEVAGAEATGARPSLRRR